MHLHVDISGAFLLVAFPADLAAVGLLSSVGQQVLLQVILGDEGLPAQVAAEGPLLLVEAEVRLQVSFGAKAFAAEAAAERFLSGVRQHVGVQRSNLPESFPTDVAGEWPLPRMNPPVNSQDLERGEALAAGLAGDAADVSVCGVVPDVGRQRAALCERLPTDLTDVRPLAAVDPPVPSQSPGSRKGLPTDAAGVRFDARVAPHVGLDVLKGVAADVANLTFLTVALQVIGQSLGRQQTLATDSTDRFRRVALGMFPKISSAPKSLCTDFALGWWKTRHPSGLTLWIRVLGVLYRLCVFSPL